MNKLFINAVLADCPVTVEFNWYGEEPDWENMVVSALLPSTTTPEAKHWVKINDVLSDDDWHRIETQIYERQDELYKQAMEQEY